MDDPGIAWPAWKFGMKRDALFTTLHKEYNTFQSTIQDPDAFHHDVFEIASEASTTKEFHRLLSVRRDQRLRELNESLESASFEIIANPALIGTTQWEYALQLFRTRSLDSLVRYFASYLPSSHPWHQSGCHAVNAQNDPESEARHETAVAAAKPFFDDAITHEPAMMSHSLSRSSLHHHHDLPPSPRSLTTYSDDMETSSHELYCLNTLTPARTLSFDSDEGHNNKTVDDVVDDEDDDEECPSQFDDDTSQSSGPDTPVSMSDAEPDVAEEDSHHHHSHHHHHSPAVAFATMHQLVDAKTPPTSTPTPTPTTTTTTTKHEAIADATTPANNTITADATKINNTSLSSPHRRPLQSGFAAVDDAASRPASPMPVSVRVRHRSVSPSSSSRTCWPVPVQADSSRHHPATPIGGGIIAARRGRLASRSSHASHHASSTRASSVGRRRLGAGAGAGVEKTVLPRPMRTRLRERREAAASAAAAVEQERQ